MNFQMIDAPTNEMAIGRKITALASDSNLARSTSTAYSSPTAVAASGDTITHVAVFLSTMSCSGEVKIVR